MAAAPLTAYPLGEIIALARARAAFYARLYAGLPAAPTLAGLPLIEPDDFWEAHRRDHAEVLTGPMRDGIVLNSGGTTGTPKFSYYSDEDWDSSIALSARAYEGTGLEDGDRVANLFAAGDLYSSMLLATESLKAARPALVQFPLGYSPNFAAASAVIPAFQINVLAGFPTHLLRLIDYLDRQQDTQPIQLRRILFAGELFSNAQRVFLEKRFPGIAIRSVGYASVDAGIIAYADETCALGQHRVYDGATVVEIFDEGAEQPTGEVGQPGRIVFTSLTRRLMPLLRYPTGDLGAWVDPPGAPDRRFTLLGRSEQAARVGTFFVSVTGVRAVLEPFREPLGIEDFQLLVTRENLHDRLTLRLVGAAAPEALAAGGAEILQAFGRWQTEMGVDIAAGIVLPTRVEWVKREGIILSERTGKLLRVVDRRAEG